MTVVPACSRSRPKEMSRYGSQGRLRETLISEHKEGGGATLGYGPVGGCLNSRSRTMHASGATQSTNHPNVTSPRRRCPMHNSTLTVHLPS
jgi:hypothetical protein